MLEEFVFSGLRYNVDSYIPCIRVLRAASVIYSGLGLSIAQQGRAAGLKEAKDAVDNLKMGNTLLLDINPDCVNELRSLGFTIARKEKYVHEKLLTRKLVKLLNNFGLN